MSAARAKTFGAVITAMVTPLKKDMSVDYGKAEKLADFLVRNGSDGLVVCGTTGESPTLTHAEEYELFRVVKNAVGKKAKIIGGTGSNSTATAIQATKEAEKIGVDGALVVVPYYNKPPQDAMLAHFTQVAKSTSLPIIIYNIPGRTGTTMQPETVARCAELKNICGVKDSVGNMEHTAEVKRRVPPDFMIYSGDDGVTLPLLSVGACGVISVVSHLVGKEMSKMCAHFFAGKNKEALKIHLHLLPLFKALFVTTNPVLIKAAVNLSIMDCGGLRLPLLSANEKQVADLKVVLKMYGLLKQK